jgi:hypothetical protein
VSCITSPAQFFIYVMIQHQYRNINIQDGDLLCPALIDGRIFGDISMLTMEWKSVAFINHERYQSYKKLVRKRVRIQCTEHDKIWSYILIEYSHEGTSFLQLFHTMIPSLLPTRFQLPLPKNVLYHILRLKIDTLTEGWKLTWSEACNKLLSVNYI